MKKRFIAVAVPVLIAGSLAATAPGTSQAARGDRAAEPPAPTAAKAQAQAQAAIAPCTGGAQKKAMTGGSSDWVQANSPITIPGTVHQFKGPGSGKDTVFVTLTAHHTYVSDNGDVGRVRVLLDGVDMNPTAGGNEYFYNLTNYGSLAGQYCGKVGPGFHKVRVILENFDDGDASGSSYLFNPMVHVEVAN